MESMYRFSKPVPRHLYDHPDYFSVFIPRIHQDSVLAEESAQKCHDDMAAGHISDAKAKVDNLFLSVGKSEGQKLLEESRQWEETTGDPFDMDTASFDEYTAHRIQDGGIPVYRKMIPFASGISLNEDDEQLVKNLCKQLFTAFMLTNDYFSFDKEYEEYLQSGLSRIPDNSIFYLMKSLSQNEARTEVKSRIMFLEREYLVTKYRYLAEGTPNPKILKCLTLVELGMAGNMLWSITAPRYHSPMSSESGLCLGTTNPVVGNDSALVFCETLPERMSAIAYALEFFFLWDDAQELSKHTEASTILATGNQLVAPL